MKKPKQKSYPSMAAASAGMSIPAPILKRLKAANCPGFARNGLVDAVAVTRFIEEHPELLSTEGLPAGYDPLKTAQVEKLRFELEVKRGKYESIDVVKASWARAMESVMAVLQRLMTREDFNCAIRQIKAEIRTLDL